MTKVKKQLKEEKQKQEKKQQTVKQAPKTTHLLQEDGTKICPKCGRKLEKKNFPTDNSRKDHLYIYCRDCEAQRQKDKNARRRVKNLEENGVDVLKEEWTEEPEKENQPVLMMTELQPAE